MSKIAQASKSAEGVANPSPPPHATPGPAESNFLAVSEPFQVAAPVELGKLLARYPASNPDDTRRLTVLNGVTGN